MVFVNLNGSDLLPVTDKPDAVVSFSGQRHTNDRD